MNIEAAIIKKKYGFSKLLNHTAMIEKTENNILIWEATVNRGVAPTALHLYENDVVFIITSSPFQKPSRALEILKNESGKGYDVKSWFVYFKYLVSGKWSGGTSYSDYSKRWFCSEIVDDANSLSPTPWYSTPNHVYEYTKDNEHWSGTIEQFKAGLNNNSIIIQ